METKQYVHTWHGKLYCGAIELDYAKDLCEDFLQDVDPDGKFEAEGYLEYTDFDGIKVVHTLEDFEHEPTKFPNR